MSSSILPQLALDDVVDGSSPDLTSIPHSRASNTPSTHHTGLLRVERSLARHEGVCPLKSRQQGESRTIPLPADVGTRLRQHPVPLLPGGWLILTSTGNAMSDSNWRKRTWTKIKETSGVECRPHDLRHTVATRLFTVTRWTPGEVQRYMGHLDPRVTLAIYTHITAEDLPAPPAMATLVADGTG
jgi:integrase